MRLYVWRGGVPNFGDELNDLLWPRLLPGLLSRDPFDDGRSALFLGIGSVLDSRHATGSGAPLAAPRRKIVAGAGYGGYERPASLDGSWEIYWVRGPRTARQLGLPNSFGLGDPASLLPLVHGPARRGGTTIGFMPHFESLARGVWPEAAIDAGVTLIDPRGDPAGIVSRIAGCRILLSEALHGVIVADALRVPWVALAPVAAIHHAKWLDWADALGLTVRFQPLPASSPREYIETAFAVRAATRCGGLAHAGALIAGRLFEHAGHPSIRLDHAAAALRRAATAAPQLSDGSRLARAQMRMLDRLQTLRAGTARQGRRGHVDPNPLRHGGKSK
jgi:succinoglycan biosynthesis protein ExoV